MEAEAEHHRDVLAQRALAGETGPIYPGHCMPQLAGAKPGRHQRCNYRTCRCPHRLLEYVTIVHGGGSGSRQGYALYASTLEYAGDLLSHVPLKAPATNQIPDLSGTRRRYSVSVAVDTFPRAIVGLECVDHDGPIRVGPLTIRLHMGAPVASGDPLPDF